MNIHSFGLWKKRCKNGLFEQFWRNPGPERASLIKQKKLQMKPKSGLYMGDFFKNTAH